MKTQNEQQIKNILREYEISYLTELFNIFKNSKIIEIKQDDFLLGLLVKIKCGALNEFIIFTDEFVTDEQVENYFPNHGFVIYRDKELLRIIEEKPKLAELRKIHRGKKTENKQSGKDRM